ncbi:MAG: LptA/OstA family protein [Bdellovibrionota bacterium]
MLSSKTKPLSLVLSLATLGLVFGLGLPARRLKADIITDIEELEKEKDPNKKPAEKEKKKKETKDSSKDEVLPGQPSVKKPQKPESTKTPTENPDPEIQAVIPEPIEEPLTPEPKVLPMKSSKGKTKDQRNKAPVHVASEGTTTYSQDRMTVTLQKSVMITQDDLRLQSDDAKVTFLPKGAANSGVKTAVLDGKVAISRYSTDPTERMTAKSDKATFDNVQQLVTLDGNARLWQNGNLVKGERIVYDLTTGMIKIDKAQGVVQPDRMKK